MDGAEKTVYPLSLAGWRICVRLELDFACALRDAMAKKRIQSI